MMIYNVDGKDKYLIKLSKNELFQYVSCFICILYKLKDTVKFVQIRLWY